MFVHILNMFLGSFAKSTISGSTDLFVFLNYFINLINGLLFRAVLSCSKIEAENRVLIHPLLSLNQQYSFIVF